jgi:hypothetical protein
VEENKNRQPLNKQGAVPPKGKGRAKKIPFARRAYRALYTAVYVAAQLLLHAAGWLAEKAEALLVAVLRVLYPYYRKGSAWFFGRLRADERKEGAKEERAGERDPLENHPGEEPSPKESTAPAKDRLTLRQRLKAYVQREKSKPKYREKDYLEFEEQSTGKKRKKELPTFDELLQHKEEATQKRMRGAKRALVVFLAAVLALQIAAFSVSAGVYVYTGNDFTIGSMDVYFREGKSYSRYSVSKKAGYTHQGSPKVDLNALAKFLKLETVSDQNCVYYTMRDGKRIVLTRNSAVALLDGVKVNLSEAVVFSGTRVLVSVELITEYTEGLLVSYSEKETRLTIQRQKDEELSNSRETVYKEWKLNVSALEEAPLPEVVF